MAFDTFDHGIHPLYFKDFTSHKKIEKAPVPKRVVIPLQQHIGAPCQPLVQKKDEVVEGQKIGDVKAFVSAPVHASISGKVKDIAKYSYPGGGKVEAIVIEGDGTSPGFAEEEEISLDLESLTPEDMRLKIREAGIVGMGGAGFPTHVKLSPPDNKKISTLIINGCECEPYLNCDYRMMLEETKKLLWGMFAVMKVVGAEKAYIGVEVNKLDAIEKIKKEIRPYPHVEVVPLEVKYPQGAEKMLIKAILDKIVPMGRLPFDVDVLVSNVGTAIAIYNALRYGRPLIERVVTVAGVGVNESKNLLVRLGTSFNEVIDACGGFVEGQHKVIMGGPLMGVALGDLSAPVIKGTTGIIALMKDDIQPGKYDPCIRCADCVDVCPVYLMPLKIADFGNFHRLEEFKAFGGMACIECGCCSFVCPSKRPLVQWIRIGKARLREAEQKETEAA
jgi:electron transport complex protein RnfC